jgi:hypothetical protein
MIDITGLSKGAVLAALYNDSDSLGMGRLGNGVKWLTEADGDEHIKQLGMRFDYLYGRVMKVDLSGDSFDPRLYDRDLGEGSAARVIETLRRVTP